MELNRIIKELLATNNFVSLPGIGSFTQSYQAAKLSADGKTFSPPRQLIFFDSTRKFNDGAIENYLIKTQGIPPSEAESAMGKYIEAISLALEKGTLVEFEGVGSLQGDVSGKITFIPAPLNEGATTTFGLGNVLIEPKQDQTSTPQPKQIVIPHSGSRKKGHFVLILLLVLFIISAGFLATYFVPQLRFWKTNELAQSSSVEPQNKTNATDTAIPMDSVTIQQDSIAPDLLQNQLTADKKRALYYEEPKKQDDRTYYIVAGSFSTQVNAQKFSASLAKKGFSSEIIQGNGNYRVSIARFSDKNRAFSELERYRKENPKESYWVLGQ